MRDPGCEATPDDVLLRRELARLRAEVNALLRWALRHARRFPISGPRRRWVAQGDSGIAFGATAEEAIRNAAGLDVDSS